MDRNSNQYTFIYAAAMVILIAAVLSIVAMALKPMQSRNIEIEKKQNILASVNIVTTPQDAEEVFANRIINSYVINFQGDIIDGEAFDIELRTQKTKPMEQRQFPVFECQTEDGLKYIFPLRGSGLWGPLWGYIALYDDLNTIYGANFDHQSETPGLGAEISTAEFQETFKGKRIFDNAGNLFSIIVAKPNESAPAEHRVDAISGGTITSKGLEDMLLEDLRSYLNFITRKKTQL
jgi:Na+-transporting NADH:ubiquinone oxidoreductase subunit C